MLLVVDVGNTQTHFGAFRGQELVEHWRFATVRQSTADQLGAALSNLLELRGLTFDDLTASIVSSTVPQLESEWTAMRRAGREPNPMKLAAVSAPTSAKCRQIWGTLNLETSDVGHQPLIGEINHGKRPVCPRISDCSSTAATAAHSWALSHLPCD